MCASSSTSPAVSPHARRDNLFHPTTFATPTAGPSTTTSTLTSTLPHASCALFEFDPPTATSASASSPGKLTIHTPTSPSPSPAVALWTSNASTKPARRYRPPEEPLGPTPSPPRAVPYPPSYGMGYLAFPPAGPSPKSEVLPHLQADEEEAERQRQRRQERERTELELERERERERQAEAEARARARTEKARQEAEAEARRGEEAWVRSGGVLRDARGRRDLARTEAVRAELRLRDWEERVRARWEAYEGGWRALLGAGAGAGAGEVRFRDIPWPAAVDGEEMEVGDLTPGRVEEFLLEGLRVRGCTVTRRERVRSSLLRWHPDKMTGVLARVVQEDVEKVREGIRAITECLQALNART
ncbi:hypothetical protein LshimejAT787_0601120 [Lyophyllum shimeji]|uniref:J domain-containing protein n=1 Tax=Lyophyllum shimeji TaxID=47721 RepID=A0A9P3UPF7_LYOSH|nr:hypothetical protein LshimejAT787_0601120 [Lyophyllum shimeji]